MDCRLRDRSDTLELDPNPRLASMGYTIPRGWMGDRYYLHLICKVISGSICFTILCRFLRVCGNDVLLGLLNYTSLKVTDRFCLQIRLLPRYSLHAWLMVHPAGDRETGYDILASRLCRTVV